LHDPHIELEGEHTMHHRHLVRFLATAAVAAVAGVTVVGGPAQAAQIPAPAPGAQYVALGSSYAAGAGVGPADPGDVGGSCGRTTSAYPTLVADALGLELTNATCGGATVDNIAATPQSVLAPAPHKVGLQVDAVTAETELVTITIGGNDLNYVGNLLAESCLGDLAANRSSPLANILKQYGVCTPTPDATVLTALAGLDSKLTAMVEAVQAKAPDARIVLVDYPTLLPQNGRPCAVAPIPQDRQKFLLQVARELSLATKHVAQRTGTEFVAASKESRHHDVCSADPWMTGYDFTPGLAAMHPNEAGHAAVAAAVVQQLSNTAAA
jgi:lysophospholipase L1-like esterase